MKCISFFGEVYIWIWTPVESCILFGLQVNDLAGVSEDMTLQSLIELDIKDDCVKVAGSHSRNLLRVKRGLDMVRVLFEGLMDSE